MYNSPNIIQYEYMIIIEKKNCSNTFQCFNLRLVSSL